MNFDLEHNLSVQAAEVATKTGKAKVERVRSGKASGGKGKPKATIASTIIAGLQAGNEPAKVLKAVHKKHKGCATTIACVYWYSSRIKRGLIA